MHSTPVTSSTNRATSIEQYSYQIPSTLRRPYRPGPIGIPTFEHDNSNHINDPSINSAPIYYVRQTNNSQQSIENLSHPYTAALQYHAQQQTMQISSQQQNHQYYEQIVDSFSEQPPHTFPLAGSPNQCSNYFYFPPTTFQIDSTLTQNARFDNLQTRELRSRQQKWLNPIMDRLTVDRINENSTSMSIDHDDDPSRSMGPFVADVDSNSQDLLDDQRNKRNNRSKTSSAYPIHRISPTSRMFNRSTSHILTTPPNPLASDDHPDNQSTSANNFSKTFSPIPSAGFELTSNNDGNLTSTNNRMETSYFNFEQNYLERINLNDKNTKHLGNVNENTQDQKMNLLMNNQIGQNSTKNLIQDDNSNESSVSSCFHNGPMRIQSDILSKSEIQRQSPSSSGSNDVKLSPRDVINSQTTTMNTQQMQPSNGHCCPYSDCNKIFANKSALAKHKLTHSQDRKHKCPKCQKGFKRLDHLNGHMLTHEDNKPHKCHVPKCSRTFCDARSLKRHIENVHQDILAALYQGQHDEYKRYLPDKAHVIVKDPSINNEHSVDSIDSNSPRDSTENDQTLTTRPIMGHKSTTIYTYEEEKSVECQVCGKSFKNGAALNGHMRLHGGFNEKQPSPPSTNATENKKLPGVRKRKILNNESNTTPIKIEKLEVTTMKNSYQPSSPIQQNLLSGISTQSQLSPWITEISSNANIGVLSAIIPYQGSQLLIKVDSTGNSQLIPTSPMQIQHGDEPEYLTPSTGNRQHYLQINSSTPDFQQSNSPIHQNKVPILHLHETQPNLRISPLQPNIIYHQQPLTIVSMHNRSTKCNSPIATDLSISAMKSFTPSSSPNLPIQNTISLNLQASDIKSNNISAHMPTQTSCLSKEKPQQIDSPSLPSRDSVVQTEPERPNMLKIIPNNIESPKNPEKSGFLINTPSSSSTSNSSSSASSNKHFNYDMPPVKRSDSTTTTTTTQWPSLFRRYLSMDHKYQSGNNPPTTPYTPPPMLSPYRKGPGLYYHTFSNSGVSPSTPSLPSTPNLSFSSITDEPQGPKINIGREYQAIIPKLRTHMEAEPKENNDELLFSPDSLKYADEKSLQKFEELHRMNPYLFSPRDSPQSYPLELVYMLLHEYNGDLTKTLSALINGAALDIKQCRPIHCYHFPECDQWTRDEIDAFTYALKVSEKNFQVISQRVRTKTTKQCIEFYYMPKTNLTSSKLPPINTSSVITRRKRSQMVKAKQSIQDETLASPSPHAHSDEDGLTLNNDTSSMCQYVCDMDECKQTFSSNRAYRAHRKYHRRNHNHKYNHTISMTNTKLKKKN